MPFRLIFRAVSDLESVVHLVEVATLDDAKRLPCHRKFQTTLLFNKCMGSSASKKTEMWLALSKISAVLDFVVEVEDHIRGGWLCAHQSEQDQQHIGIPESTTDHTMFHFSKACERNALIKTTL